MNVPVTLGSSKIGTVESVEPDGSDEIHNWWKVVVRLEDATLLGRSLI